MTFVEDVIKAIQAVKAAESDVSSLAFAAAEKDLKLLLRGQKGQAPELTTAEPASMRELINAVGRQHPDYLFDVVDAVVKAGTPNPVTVVSWISLSPVPVIDDFHDIVQSWAEAANGPINLTKQNVDAMALLYGADLERSQGNVNAILAVTGDDAFELPTILGKLSDAEISEITEGKIRAVELLSRAVIEPSADNIEVAVTLVNTVDPDELKLLAETDSNGSAGGLLPAVVRRAQDIGEAAAAYAAPDSSNSDNDKIVELSKAIAVYDALEDLLRSPGNSLDNEVVQRFDAESAKLTGGLHQLVESKTETGDIIDLLKLQDIPDSGFPTILERIKVPAETADVITVIAGVKDDESALKSFVGVLETGVRIKVIENVSVNDASQIFDDFVQAMSVEKLVEVLSDDDLTVAGKVVRAEDENAYENAVDARFGILINDATLDNTSDLLNLRAAAQKANANSIAKLVTDKFIGELCVGMSANYSADCASSGLIAKAETTDAADLVTLRAEADFTEHVESLASLDNPNMLIALRTAASSAASGSAASANATDFLKVIKSQVTGAGLDKAEELVALRTAAGEAESPFVREIDELLLGRIPVGCAPDNCPSRKASGGLIDQAAAEDAAYLVKLRAVEDYKGFVDARATLDNPKMLVVIRGAAKTDKVNELVNAINAKIEGTTSENAAALVTLRTAAAGQTDFVEIIDSKLLGSNDWIDSIIEDAEFADLPQLKEINNFGGGFADRVEAHLIPKIEEASSLTEAEKADLKAFDGPIKQAVDDKSSVLRWKTFDRCGENAVKAQGECMDKNDADYYIDITTDPATADSFKSTFKSVVSLHHEGGLFQFNQTEAGTVGDDLVSRELVSKFLDQLIDDMIELEDDVNLNAMTVEALMKDMQTCPDEGASAECEEREANWAFFDEILTELINENNDLTRDAVDDMEVPEIWQRFNLGGDMNDDALESIKGKVRGLMKAATNGNDDPKKPENPDLVEEATGVCC